MGKKNKEKASSHKSLNWRKPRDTSKHGVNNDESGTNVVDTPGIFKNATESASVTPASSVAGEAVSETSQAVKKLTEKLENAIKSTNGGSDPITPPSVCRNIDFERVGPASFNYKYDAPPHTPTERFTSRSRRLFESKGPNNHFSMSPDSLPSMTRTGDSFCSVSSLGGTPRSTSRETVTTIQVDNKYSVAQDVDIKAADDTFDDFNLELAKLSAYDSGYRSVSELLTTSIPEDRDGNLILL